MDISQGNYIIDAGSTLGWKGSKKIGGSHNGTLLVKSGNINIDDSGARGEFIIDMTSIVDESLPDQESKDKLIGHLMSDDFFSVEKFPTAILKIKTIDNDSRVVADLTIKGTTNEINFPVKITAVNGKLNIEAKFEINRTLWGVKFGSGKFFENLGDSLINDEVEISLKIQGTKQ